MSPGDLGAILDTLNESKIIENDINDDLEEEDSDLDLNEEFENKLNLERKIVDKAMIKKYDPKQFSINDFNFVRVIGRGAHAKDLLVEFAYRKK